VCASDLDEFTRNLTADDGRTLVDLLKLAVAGRAGRRARETLSHLLIALGKTVPQVSNYFASLIYSSMFEEDIIINKCYLRDI